MHRNRIIEEEINCRFDVEVHRKLAKDLLIILSDENDYRKKNNAKEINKTRFIVGILQQFVDTYYLCEKL